MTYVYFFGMSSMYSNWYPAPFKWRGIQFNCSEQYYMWRKATYFDDEETAQKIMLAKHPREQKKLGKMVKNYNGNTWKTICLEVMKVGLLCKFN